MYHKFPDILKISLKLQNEDTGSKVKTLL